MKTVLDTMSNQPERYHCETNIQYRIVPPNTSHHKRHASRLRISTTRIQSNKLPHSVHFRKFITVNANHKKSNPRKRRKYCLQNGAAQGEVATATLLGKISISYTECKEETSPTKTCTTTGKAPGTIQTQAMTEKIGYAEKSSKLVGVELRPTVGVTLSEFTCQGSAEKVTVKGCTMGIITPTNIITNKFTVAFEEKTNGSGGKEQRFNGFEGGAGCKLETTAGFFELGKGPSWWMDVRKAITAAPVELTA